METPWTGAFLFLETKVPHVCCEDLKRGQTGDRPMMPCATGSGSVEAVADEESLSGLYVRVGRQKSRELP